MNLVNTSWLDLHVRLAVLLSRSSSHIVIDEILFCFALSVSALRPSSSGNQYISEPGPGDCAINFSDELGTVDPQIEGLSHICCFENMQYALFQNKCGLITSMCCPLCDTIVNISLSCP